MNELTTPQSYQQAIKINLPPVPFAQDLSHEPEEHAIRSMLAMAVATTDVNGYAASKLFDQLSMLMNKTRLLNDKKLVPRSIVGSQLIPLIISALKDTFPDHQHFDLLEGKLLEYAKSIKTV
jgi:hypothetical protein